MTSSSTYKGTLALGLLLLGACGEVSTPVEPGAGQAQLLGELIPSNQYIVVFQDAVAEPDALARTLVANLGGTLRHTYQSALKGFAAELSDVAVATLRADPRVAYVEPDQMVQLDATQQMDANGDPWGLDRIDQRALPLDRRYTYESAGAGVHVYLIDSGIWTTHAEFGGRADIVFDAFGLDGTDCSGHGTAVAGVVGSATYGVAKGVRLHGVRVYFECTPIGFASDVLAGVDWVTAHHVRPAVANLSVSLAPSNALRTAIQNLWNAGVFVAATAANHNIDACQEAGGASAAFTVAASTRSDAKASFSNWGPCVDIYAPGEGIKTTWVGGFTKTVTGTSFAAPHVTGVAAVYKGIFGDAPSDSVASWIVANATVGVIAGNPPGTPNLLLYQPASAAAGVRIAGGGAIGAGGAAAGTDRQEFSFDVTNTPGGRFFLRDFRFVRRDGAIGSLTADPAVHAATGITFFTRTSGACVSFGGTGRVDTGELVSFSVDACDHGSPGAGVDVFGLRVPYFGYSKSGTLTQGEITLSSS